MAEKAAQKSDKAAEPAVKGSEPHVDRLIGEANAQGFDGVRTDPTPLEHYTIAGVIAGKPTPETDEDAAAEARKAAAGFARAEKS